MHFTPQEIPDILLVDNDLLKDERGSFLESYQKERFRHAGIDCEFVQDNRSASSKGVLRGLHYQIRKPQGKLIYVIEGELFDVAVDLRRHSPTFGRALGITLTSESNTQIWIPPGFAHGFYVLSKRAELFYKVTDYYAPEWERTLLWSDPGLNINWPIIKGEHPILSSKDEHGSLLSVAETYD
jgi:dTDP-4-dehydrorhamnose 3,5-epimerase